MLEILAVPIHVKMVEHVILDTVERYLSACAERDSLEINAKVNLQQTYTILLDIIYSHLNGPG